MGGIDGCLHAEDTLCNRLGEGWLAAPDRAPDVILGIGCAKGEERVSLDHVRGSWCEEGGIRVVCAVDACQIVDFIFAFVPVGGLEVGHGGRGQNWRLGRRLATTV